MDRQLKVERDWSPLCEGCLSRMKSIEFRNAVLNRSKPLKYDIWTDELFKECILCALVVRQLNYREPKSASRSNLAAVSISRGVEVSEIYLCVNNHHSLSLNLFARPSRCFVALPSEHHFDTTQAILRPEISRQRTKTSIHLGPGIKLMNG